MSSGRSGYRNKCWLSKPFSEIHEGYKDMKSEKTCIKKPADSSNQCISNDWTFKYLLTVLISKLSVMGNLYTQPQHLGSDGGRRIMCQKAQ